MPKPESDISSDAGGYNFATTHWSAVVVAGHDSSPGAQAAMESLCQAYWFPLYAFVRRQGYEAPVAQDFTQEFFSRLLATKGLADVDRSKGKFRSFLLANEWHRAHTQKRGGDQPHFSLDAMEAEERYRLEPADELTPECRTVVMVAWIPCTPICTIR